MRRLWGCVAIAAVLAAGAFQAPPDQPALPARLHDVYTEMRAEGALWGASAEQLAVLDEAIAESRYLTFEEYKQAKDLKLECVRDLGFDVREVREEPRAGWTEISYLFGGLPAGSDEDALVDAAGVCTTVHAHFIALAYASTPTQEESDEQRDAYRLAFLACLEARSVDVHADAPWDELIVVDRDATELVGGQTCFEEVGVPAVG